MKLVKPIGRTRTAEVWKTEEKGSDVNLATRLLADAFDGDFDVAVILSNDSDLLLPISLIQQRFGLPVGVLNPQIGFPNPSTGLYRKATTSYALKNQAAFYRPIRPRTLGSSLFPPSLVDQNGTITKPAGW